MVSVVIPVYNCEKYLSRCVESVLNQTYKNIECIIIDDGSTDGKTPELCEKLKKKDLRIVVSHKQNEDSQRAREMGVSISKGQYIIFVDADDYLEETIIEKCVFNIEDTKSDIVCFDYCLNQNGKKGFDITKSEQMYSNDAIKNMLIMNKLDGNTWAKLYKKELFYNVIFETKRNCDFVTVMTLLRKSSKVSIIPEVGYYYCVIDGSQSHNNNCHSCEEEYEETAQQVYESYKHDPDISVQAEYYWLYSLLYVCIRMEKDKMMPRNNDRFKRVKRLLRKEMFRYYRNPYSNFRDRVQYLLCYLNLFRLLYSLVK